MRSKLTAVMGCIIMMTLLTGCFGGGGSGSSSSGGGITIAGGGGDLGGGSLPHNPEPATIALLGSGLAAYALYHYRKNSKKR